MILLYTAFNLPYVIWMMRGYILDIPRALEESALVDGCTRWQVIWKVVFPMSRAGLFATAIFTFVFAWNDFIFALVLTRTEVDDIHGTGHALLWRTVELLGQDLGDVGAGNGADFHCGGVHAALPGARNLAGGGEGIGTNVTAEVRGRDPKGIRGTEKRI